MSVHSSVYREKQEVYGQVYGRCVYGILQLQRDSFYARSHVSIQCVYPENEGVY